MKRIITTSIIFLLSITTILAANRVTSKNDTTTYSEVTGKIVDSKTSKPVIFASVVLTNTSIATVSNSDGEFIIKIPKGKETGTISFTHLGYENSVINISELKTGKNQIELTSTQVPLDEVVIRSIDPIKLILSALDKIRQNYSIEPEMQTSFYRETIKQNKKYVSVSEAVLDIYKAPYKTSFETDRMKIYKGRKSRDVKKMDTLLVKLQGGPRTSLILDVVKNPGDVLHPEMLEYYEFKLEGITTIDNREAYIIKFDQLEGIEYPLYSGDIYIDIETNAFAGLDFGLSERGLKYASGVLVKKKPNSLKIDVISGHYLVRYRKDSDAWYLNYVRSELSLQSKWKKKLFKSNYNIMLEMAVTDRSKEQVEKFTMKESVKINDVFAEQVSSFEDEDFWGENNTIKPNESIESAIKRLNKKVKRQK